VTCQNAGHRHFWNTTFTTLERQYWSRHHLPLVIWMWSLGHTSEWPITSLRATTVSSGTSRIGRLEIVPIISTTFLYCMFIFYVRVVVICCLYQCPMYCTGKTNWCGGGFRAPATVPCSGGDSWSCRDWFIPSSARIKQTLTIFCGSYNEMARLTHNWYRFR